MDRSLCHTIAALTDCELAVEVTSSPREHVAISVRDPRSGLEERRSFLPEQMEKAASWLHGTAVRAFPASRYARQAEEGEAVLSASDGEAADLKEWMRQGVAGQG